MKWLQSAILLIGSVATILFLTCGCAAPRGEWAGLIVNVIDRDGASVPYATVQLISEKLPLTQINLICDEQGKGRALIPTNARAVQVLNMARDANE